jgi:hypothetical protein
VGPPPAIFGLVRAKIVAAGEPCARPWTAVTMIGLPWLGHSPEPAAGRGGSQFLDRLIIR